MTSDETPEPSNQRIIDGNLPSMPAPPLPPPAEPIGTRSKRTETTTRWFDAEGKLTGETHTTQLSYIADDKPDPGGYL